MAEKAQHPSIMHEVGGPLLLQSAASKDIGSMERAVSPGFHDLSMFSSTASPGFVQAPSEKLRPSWIPH
ncbi:unnamed protein product [Rhodiola kirilowii]